MKIGIYGGSFNPPHVAHLIVAELVRDQFALDKILWIPSFIPPHKTHLKLVDAGHRLEMTRLATASNPAFSVSSLEIDRKGTSFTVDTVKHLLETCPEDEFFLLIGEDNLHEFMSWHQPEVITSLVQLLVYRRPDTTRPPVHKQPVPEAVQRFPGCISYADAPLVEISSASIRKKLAAGHSVRHLVPDPVYQYILRHNLYIAR